MSPIYSEPDFLNDEEIEDIITVTPQVIAGTKDIAEKIRQEINNISKLQLRDHKICKEAIPELKQIIENLFIRSRVQPGMPIGMATAAAVGAPLTQSNLNTFHHTGNAKTVGIEAFEELFNGTAIRKEESTILHFENKNLTVEEILEYKRHIVGISVGELCISNEIKDYESFRKNKNWWYSLYSNVMGKKLPKSKYFLRLKFSLDALYKYKVTLANIVNKFENNSSQKIVECVASPLTEGIIDIYPIEELLDESLKKVCSLEDDCSGIDDDNRSLIFLEVIVRPSLNSLIIKGVPGINKLFPITINTLTMFLQTSNVIGDDRRWVIWLDIVKIHISGFSRKKIFTFLEQSNIKITKKTERYLEVKLPKDWKNIFYEEELKLLEDNNYSEEIMKNKKIANFLVKIGVTLPLSGNIKDNINNAINEKLSSVKLLDYLNHKIKKEEEIIKIWILKEKNKGVIYPIYKYSDFWKSATYVYCELSGSNLKTLLSKDFVDTSRTYSNNPHEILATFDIEACRNFLALNFYNMLNDSGSYINAKYVYLLPDFMTNNGVIMPITSRGISKHGKNAFAQASFQEPLVYFVRSAISGRKESISSVSASIFLGNRTSIGTGLPKFSLRQDVLDKLDRVNIDEYQKYGIFSHMYDNKNDKGVGVTKDKIDFGQDAPPPQDIDLENLIKNVNLKEKDTDTLAPLGPKGPIPEIISDSTLPDYFKGIDLDVFEDDLPNLGNLTLEKILKKITTRVMSDKNKINDVKFVDLSSFMANVKKYT